MKKHLPNFITCLNLISGCLGIIEVFNGRPTVAAWLIFLACVFDFLDGFAARMLKVTSAIGKELDSLADMVTFGVLPGMIIYSLLLNALENETSGGKYVAFVALLIPVFSALRLAKFNIDTRQSEYFLGLPTPANSILIASFPLIIYQNNNEFVDQIFVNPVFLVLISLLCSFLLVSEVRLLAFKFKGFGWKENIFRYILLVSALILSLIFKFYSIPIIIVLYIVLSIVEKKYNP